ncbi:unnamed protein product [Prunus armeniaca]
MAVPLFNLAPNLTDSESDSLVLPLILKYKFILRWDDDFRRAKHISGLDQAFQAGISAEMYPVVTGPSGQMTWIRDGPKCLNAKNITEAIDGSLRRLQTHYIDLYQIHWPDPSFYYVPMFGEIEYDPTRQFCSIPIDEQLDALGRAVYSGKIKYVGLSNETPYGVMKFVQVAERSTRHPKIVSGTHTACSVKLLILGWLNAVIMRGSVY